MRRGPAPAVVAPVVVALLVLGGCTTGTAGSTAPRTTRPAQPTLTTTPGRQATTVPAVATLTCEAPIDGSPPPADFDVVLGVVALPTSATTRALAAYPGGDPTAPALFAKTGLLVRAGQSFELAVPPQPGNLVGIAWGGGAVAPSSRFVVPACPDRYGTGWLSYPGGYWVDHRLCLPLTVRAGGREQQVRIGIGASCPGQAPPA